MKAALLTSKGFVVKDIPMVDCKDDEVLVKTVGIGVCEGDVFQYKTRAGIPDGEERLIGHEGSGVVVKVGKNIKSLKVGDKVTALGGLYSEYFVCTEDRLLKLSDKSDPKWALGEPIACFVYAASRFKVKPGDRVAMIGCGYMGIGCLIMAKIQGAAEVVAIEPLDWRRTSALKAGATKVYDPTGKSADDVLADLGEFDVVIEATGVESVIEMCTKLVKQHGVIVLVGYHQSNNGMRTVDMKTWNFKAIDIINGHVRLEGEKYKAMQYGMELQDAKKLDFSSMIEYYPIDQITKAFTDLVDRKPGLYKAVLTF